jgi:hypothetical protein
MTKMDVEAKLQRVGFGVMVVGVFPVRERCLA